MNAMAHDNAYVRTLLLLRYIANQGRRQVFIGKGYVVFYSVCTSILLYCTLVYAILKILQLLLIASIDSCKICGCDLISKFRRKVRVCKLI